MSIKESEESVLMLENIVKTRDLEILNLNQEMRNVEATNNCQNVTDKNSEKHAISEHVDEVMPSTSKCGKCDYESDEESDIKTHIESAHKFRCDLCDFQADFNGDLDTHKLFEHNNPCSECINTFRTPDKLEQHICKLEITNPNTDLCIPRIGWMEMVAIQSIALTKAVRWQFYMAKNVC